MDEQLKIAVTDLWTEMLRMACEHRLHSSEAGSVITVALRAYGEAQSQAQRERDAGIANEVAREYDAKHAVDTPTADYLTGAETSAHRIAALIRG